MVSVQGYGSGIIVFSLGFGFRAIRLIRREMGEGGGVGWGEGEGRMKGNP